MNEILIYTRDVKANGKTFTVIKGILKDKVYVDVILWDEATDKIADDLHDKKMDYPVILTLNDSDYYIKKKTTKKGDKTFVNYRVYIKDYRDIKQGSYPQNRTLDDVIAELEKVEA